MNNPVFGKTIENRRSHRNIKLLITKPRRNYLVSNPNCHATTFCGKSINNRNEKNANTHE